MNILPVTSAPDVASAASSPSFSLDPSVVVLLLLMPLSLAAAYFIYRWAKAIFS